MRSHLLATVAVLVFITVSPVTAWTADGHAADPVDRLMDRPQHLMFCSYLGKHHGPLSHHVGSIALRAAEGPKNSRAVKHSTGRYRFVRMPRSTAESVKRQVHTVTHNQHPKSTSHAVRYQVLLLS